MCNFRVKYVKLLYVVELRRYIEMFFFFELQKGREQFWGSALFFATYKINCKTEEDKE